MDKRYCTYNNCDIDGCDGQCDHNKASSCKSDLLCVGDLVRPISEECLLASGCSRYDFAVVVSVNPFVLVSEKSDMKWSSTVKPENFIAFGTAKPEMLERCRRRLYT